MNVYFLSGLGADKRVFAKLILPERLIIHHIEWIEPFKKESINGYAMRLSTQIDTSKSFVLVGLSFGGILAVEMTKFLKPRQTIIISSITTRTQLPWYYKLAGKLQLQRFIPVALLKSANPVMYWLFGANTKTHQHLLKQILIDTDEVFLKWAIRVLPNWDNKIRPKQMLHIHGSKDWILPLKSGDADIMIEGGGHLMVHNLHEQVSEALTANIQLQ